MSNINKKISQLLRVESVVEKKLEDFEMPLTLGFGLSSSFRNF